MKKKFTILFSVVLTFVLLFSFAACNNDNFDASVTYKDYATEIDKEMKGSFDFFWNEAQTDEWKPTYGLIVDRWPSNKNCASVASVGFGLTAYVIGVENGYVTKQEAELRSKKTLQTILNLQGTDDVSWNGFLAHFIDMESGKRLNNCEISSVDTAILLCGALTAGEYFGGEVAELANQVYSNVNWNSFIKKRGSKSYISMAYNPQTGNISDGCWDWYAEQLMIYVLGAGSPVEEYRLDDKTYYDFTRSEGSYNGHKFIHSYFGSIFTYQYSHAWIDFSDIVDKKGVNWYQNSVEASKAAYEYCQDNKGKSKTFQDGGWGLTACDAPNGYNGYLGTPPRGWTANADYGKYEGTVAPAGALGSVVFTPKQSLEALKYYQTLRLLNGKYGLCDSYNLDYDYFAPDCIGIDKGITLAMLANFKDKTVWNVMMKNQYVQNGLQVLGFTAVE